ncbi:MAG: urease accessory protein UreD [Ilumatobacteraceae bacterium]
MHASTELEVGLDAVGASVLRRMHCEVPLVVRVDTGADELTIVIVNGAAGPLGGDELHLSLVVADGARVRVRSVAASMAQPGPTDAWSTTLTRLVVGEGAHLDWDLEPTISVCGSRHRARTTLDVAATGSATVAESVWLGRHGQDPGVLALRQRVTEAGRAVLDHETVLGAGRLGPGAHGPWRWVRSVITIGDDACATAAATVADGRADAVFPLAPRCSLATTTAVVPLPM